MEKSSGDEKMIQIYDSRINRNRNANIDAGTLAGWLCMGGGIGTEIYDCFCQMKPDFLRILKLEGVVILNPCDEEKPALLDFPCWARVRQIIQSNPVVPFYIDIIKKPYRTAIGKFPNLTYIEESTPDEVIDKLLLNAKTKV